MPRRSLRLRRQDAALPPPTQHADIKPIFDDSSPRHQQAQDDNLVDYPHHQHQADNPTDYFDSASDKHNLENLDLAMNDVRSGSYRVNCLKLNGIYFQLPSNPLPPAVALVTEQILTVAAATPPSLAMLAAMMDKLDELGTHGCTEMSIRLCLDGLFATTTLPPGLRACHQRSIARHLVPDGPAGPALPQPQPDLLYGCCTWTAFTQAQQITLGHIHPSISSYAQANAEITFPFFVVELKAAAGTGGSLWDAANQCAGGAAACLRALDQLNTALGAVGCQRRIPNLCYSLAMDNNSGQLYVSSKAEDGSTVYVQRVASYLLSDAEHFARLHACVAAILKWGATTRLQDIRAAADYMGGGGGE